MMLRCKPSLASTSGRSAAARRSVSSGGRPSRRSAVVVQAIDDTNLFVNLFASGACGAAATAVTLATAEKRCAPRSRASPSCPLLLLHPLPSPLLPPLPYFSLTQPPSPPQPQGPGDRAHPDL